MVEGERLLGRFTVGERIGGGGHGMVHRAWDERLCRWVAIKSVEGEPAERVLREAHAAARLNHPGIVTLYELGQQNGCAYLVSELVDGPNLRELAVRGELTDREVADLGAELCAALAHAHAAGVVHRDLKPDNVLVRRRPQRNPASPLGRFSRDSGERALLADFGIAAVADAPTLTQTGQVVGTLSYMSPEQAAGEGAGPPSDVYSLALTLYELWAGFNPVVRGTPAATARAIGEPLETLGYERPELPHALCEAVDACLDPDPDERPGIGDLREALVSVRGTLHPDRPVPEPLDPRRPGTLPPGASARPFAILLGAGAVALLGALAGMPGLALVIAILLVPALLLLSRPSEWIRPALAPILGAVGAAPGYLALAARHEAPGARAALAGLGWAWTAIAGALLGRGLGVGEVDAASGWIASGPVALDGVLAALASQEAISAGLIWVGAAVLLGLLLDATRPAGAAIGGLLWIAGVVAALGAAGGGAAPPILLTPALVVAVAWAVWDRHGRAELRRPLGAALGRGLPDAILPGRDLAPPPATVIRRPRNPAGAPPADDRLRATRRAEGHVRAALHGSGAQPGPHRSPQPRSAAGGARHPPSPRARRSAALPAP